MNKRLLRWMILLVGLWGLALGVLAQQTVSNTTTLPSDLVQLIGNIRADLEVLADLVYGGGTRPDTWSGNADTTSASIVADIWYDNEQLADEIFGVGARPLDWIGATTSNALLVTRNIRHDLELSADQFIGADLRPQNWVGAPKVFRCNRTTQNVLYLIQTIYGVTPTTLDSVLNYCAAVQGELSNELISKTFNNSSGDPTNFPSLILAMRGDLERLADEKLGLGARPEGWRGNKDVNSPFLKDDNFADLELLADTLVGLDQRPTGWIGSVGAVEALAYRNLRHDLELLADYSLGEGVRPRGWQGEDVLSACSPAIQDLVLIVQRNYSFTPSIPSGDTATVCASVESQANLIAENPPSAEATEEPGQGGGAEESPFTAESQIAFAYLDAAATQFMGEMPLGTKFVGWYRGYNESSMMFVSGEDFAVYIDRRWTTMSEELFNGMPSLDGVKPLAFCDASWCNGPRATPTPTGGVLFDIILGATPPATLPPGSNTDSSGKKLVSWNHIRVTYVLQNSSTGKAQVTLEICQETTQVTCEPVLSILNTSTGVQVPVLSNLNGLNVFELQYGYSSNLIIEGTTLFSQDVWLNDPALTGGG